MRHAYLKRSRANSTANRGGVGDSHGTGYELEIGNGKPASTNMLSLCVHYDEIMKFLEQSSCPLAKMLLRSINLEKKKLDDVLNESDQNPTKEQSHEPDIDTNALIMKPLCSNLM